jgi:organic radical activating enzyme
MKKGRKTISKQPALKAPVSEIFFSYQGEGLFVGQPQIFVRFAGCNLRCDYCDTPRSRTLSEKQEYFSVQDIVRAIQKLAKENDLANRKTFPLSVSLTGGEPLLYPGFLQELLPVLKKLGFQVYLETNSTLPEAFGRLKQWVDVVSADIKLPSSCAEPQWDEHKRFLKLAGKKAFVKLVLSGHTSDDEVAKAVQLVKASGKDLPFVLQPCTPVNKCRPVEPAKIFEWATLARKQLSRVHVLPQMHKVWKVK